MKIQLSDHAKADLLAGVAFYEAASIGVGEYFLDSLTADIDSLILSAGSHRIVFGYHRSLSLRFPFAIYYLIEGDLIRIRRVLDCRRDPSWIQKQVKSRSRTRR